MFKKAVLFLILSLLVAGGGFFLFDAVKLRKLSVRKAALHGKQTPEGTRQMILGESEFKKAQEENKKYWALKNIKVDKAWEETKGRPDIVVAVCDTGVHARHSCLKPNLWVNKKEIPDNGKDDDGNGYADDIHGWNFVDNNNDIQDKHGHGTHISGIIAAAGKTEQSKNCKVIGIAPKVKIMTLKYYDMENGENNIKNTVKCVDYAIANGAHIINYSGGGPGENLDERAAVARANDKGILFVAASGNESEEIEKESKYYPASYNLPNILSVNSKNPQGKILESSNWVKMDWRKKEIIHNQTGPGERIWSTIPPRRYVQSRLSLVNFLRYAERGAVRWSRSTASVAKRYIPAKIFSYQPLRGLARSGEKDDEYGYMTGTSQATGVAAGLAALLKSRYPEWDHRQIIRQINNTGYSDEAAEIKAKTNQGKTLRADEAVSMRDENISRSDKPKSAGDERNPAVKAVIKIGDPSAQSVTDGSEESDSQVSDIQNIQKALKKSE